MQHMYKRVATGANATALHYYYDPSGNRVGKGIQYGSATSSSNVYTWYVRDAQGNVLAVYKVEGSSLTTTPLKLVEHHIYGSSRLGIINRNIDADQTERVTTDATNTNLGKTYLANFTRGNKLFELTNHLGNVLLTVTDAKVPTPLSGNPSQVGSYSVNMVTATDYTPFGMIMQGRNYNSVAATKYRYGFNGQEFSNEIKSNANHFTAEYWEYDPRVGRRWNMDPVIKEQESSYAAFSNNPILFVDVDGADTSKPDLLSRLDDVLLAGAGKNQQIADMLKVSISNQFEEIAINRNLKGKAFNDMMSSEAGSEEFKKNVNLFNEYQGKEETHKAALGILAGELYKTLTHDDNIKKYNEFVNTYLDLANVSLTSANIVASFIPSGGSSSAFFSGAFGKSVSRVFWSGSKETQREAMKYASLHGLKTLEMTTPGKILMGVDKVFGASGQNSMLTRPFWKLASKWWASGTTGYAHALNAETGIKLKSIWVKEFSILKKKGTEIIYH